MGALFKFLIICFAVYLLLKWLLKPILRIIFQRILQDFANKQGGQAYKRYSFGEEKRRSEGQISVDYVPPKDKGATEPSEKTGEYIDYEEIK